jgi:hypothetical protein
MLNKYDFEKLMHDLKRIAKCIPILRDEKEEERRKLISQLLIEECDRLANDLNEMKENGGNNGNKL